MIGALVTASGSPLGCVAFCSRALPFEGYINTCAYSVPFARVPNAAAGTVTSSSCASPSLTSNAVMTRRAVAFATSGSTSSRPVTTPSMEWKCLLGEAYTHRSKCSPLASTGGRQCCGFIDAEHCDGTKSPYRTTASRPRYARKAYWATDVARSTIMPSLDIPGLTFYRPGRRRSARSDG